MEREPDQRLARAHDVTAHFMLVQVNRSPLELIARLFEEKALRTNVGTVLPLRDARVAHEMLDRKIPQPKGKIVLKTPDETILRA